MDRVIVKPFSKDSFELIVEYSYNGINIPAGYTTNGADIPRAFWWAFPPNSPEYLSAVVVHDYLCEKAKNKNDKLKADKVFYTALRELGVSWLKARLFYHSCYFYHKVFG